VVPRNFRYGIMKEVLYVDMGLMEYEKAYTLQKNLVNLICQGDYPETLLLLEHSPVYTAGRLHSGSDILKDIPVIPVDRGGSITYHGPGQVVGYPLLRVKKRVSKYIRTLEESLILLLEKYSIQGVIKEGFPGVWVENKKIASIGVRIKNGVSYHGFALNVNTDLERFTVIRPCGLDVVMTSMEEVLSKKVSMERIKNGYINYFETCFDVKVIEKKLNCLDVMSV
jgi:lipoate-protein ligase B